MKRLLYNFIRSISKKWNVDTISKISEKWRVIKSQWIAGKMAEAGDGVFFKYVAQLHDPQYIRIGNNTSFGKDLYLTAWGGVVIESQIFPLATIVLLGLITI